MDGAREKNLCIALPLFIALCAAFLMGTTPTSAAPYPELPLGYGTDIEVWWSTHPFNPETTAGNYIPIGGIDSPSPILNVKTHYGGDIQKAIDALPSTGGTLFFEPGEYANGAFALIGKNNVHFVSDGSAIIKGGGTDDWGEIGGAHLAGCAEGIDVQLVACVNGQVATCLVCVTAGRIHDIYFKNLVFDGAGTAKSAVTIRAANSVIFDNVTFRDFAPPSTTTHPGAVNGMAVVDNIWFRGTKFLGSGRWAVSLDGCHHCGVVQSHVDYSYGSGNTNGTGAFLYKTNNDASGDYNLNGTYEDSEKRQGNYIVNAHNTFGPGGLFGEIRNGINLTAKNTLAYKNAFLGPTYINFYLQGECDPVHANLPYDFFNNRIIENFTKPTTYFVLIDGSRYNCSQNTMQLGNNTVKSNSLDQPSNPKVAYETGPMDVPNVTAHNCVGGKDFETGAPCTVRVPAIATPTPSTPTPKPKPGADELFLPMLNNKSEPSTIPVQTPVSTQTPPETSHHSLHYGVLELAGNVTGPSDFEAYIAEWKSLGFDTTLVANNIPDLSVSDRLQYGIVASPLYDLYRQWFYYEQYHNGAPLCGGNVTIDCARQIINPIIDPLVSHPSVKGYYTIDDAAPAVKERVQLASQVFEERDAQHPAAPGLLPMWDGLEVYDTARSNGLMVYDYPVRLNSLPCDFYNDRPRDWVAQTRETAQLRPEDVPLWVALQTHSTSELRQPTVEEVRLENWLALGEEARGIFWFIWSTIPGEPWIGLKDNPPLLAEVTDLAKRVDDLRPYIEASRKISDKFAISPFNSAYISTLKNPATGAYYVIAANHACAAQELTITSWYFGGQLQDLETGQVYSLGSPIPFRGGDGKMFELVNRITLAVTPTPQPNLVKNPSFEQEDTWTTQPSASRDTATRHTGSYSLKVVGSSSDLIYQNVPLKPDTKYYLSFYEKAQDLAEGYLGVQYLQTGPATEELSVVRWKHSGTYEWTKRVGFFKTPADYSAGQIRVVWSLNSGATAWIDDIVLCEAEKPCEDSYLKERE